MTATHKNRVRAAIGNAPGLAGALTLGAAAAGYRTLGASDDGLSFDVLLTDATLGDAWEVRTGCTYTHAGTTLARGTLEDSSTGAAIALTSSTVVTVTATAAWGNQVQAALAAPALGITANQVAAVSASNKQGASPGYVVLSPDTTVLPRCTSQANITGGTAGVTFTPVTIDGERWLQCSAVAQATTTSTAFNLAFDLPALTFPVNCDAVTIECYNPTPLGSPYQLSFGTAGNFTVESRNVPWSVGAAGGSDPLGVVGVKTQVHAHRTGVNLAASGYAGESILQPFDVFKFTVFFATTVTAGQTLTFYVRSVVLGGTARKGRLCIVSDDGYASWMQRGVPLFARRGIKTTTAVIAPKAGATSGIDITSDFTTVRALQDYVAAGNFCVAHGPSAIDGPLNLFLGSLAGAASPATTAARVADMTYARDWLLARGLTDARGAACYVWPQGVFNSGAGEGDLLDAAYAAGFRLARGAIQYPGSAVVSASNYERFCDLRTLSKTNRWRMFVPILGHNYAGASSTPDDAAETANIAKVVLAIQNLAASGCDAFLMLHRVVNRGAAPAAGISIEVDRLDTLAAAIQTLVQAGTLECVGMPELVDYAHLA